MKRAALGLVLIAPALFTVTVSASKVAHAAPSSVMAWTTPKTLPESTGSGPALAVYNGDLYMAWSGPGSPHHIWYASFNGSTWSAKTELSAVTGTSASPALAAYNGDLYLAWAGAGSPHHIWYSAFNGTTWTAQKELSHVTQVYLSPGLGAFDGKLYLAWIGTASAANVEVASFNGTAWSSNISVASGASEAPTNEGGGPALAAYGNALYVAWLSAYGPQCATPFCLEYVTYNGTAWTAPGYVAGQAVDYDNEGGTALAVDGSLLYAAWYSEYDATVDYTSFNGTKWSATVNIPNSVSPTCESPALATYDGSLYATWQGGQQVECAVSGPIISATGP